MKKIKRVITLILISLAIFSISNCVYAEETSKNCQKFLQSLALLNQTEMTEENREKYKEYLEDLNEKLTKKELTEVFTEYDLKVIDETYVKREKIKDTINELYKVINGVLPLENTETLKQTEVYKSYENRKILDIKVEGIEYIKQFVTTNEQKEVEESTLGKIIDNADNFLKQGENEAEDALSTDNLSTVSKSVYNIFFSVGIIIAFIVGGILGIKFMVSGYEGKAEVKTMLVPYIVGCIVLFGAFGIWRIVVLILQG